MTKILAGLVVAFIFLYLRNRWPKRRAAASIPLTPVPSAEETGRLLQDLIKGRRPSAVRLLRGLVHRGALQQGYTAREALEAAAGIPDDAPVVFKVKYE